VRAKPGMFKDLTKVEFTNLEKILYPELRITKGQVIEYYIRMAPKMLELLVNRPLVMTRFPDGIDKEGFYEKDAPVGTPSWVETFRRFAETSQREIGYVVCNSLDTLVWLANLAALEIHMTLSRTGSFETPDLVLFDLDPKPPSGFDEAATVALLLKQKLDALGLRSYVKTSGKNGLHVVVPIVDGYSFEQTREFVHQIARELGKESETVVSEFTSAKKPGVVFIDYRQNSYGRTMICPYSLRATAKATVSMPLSWDDFKKQIKPSEFTLFTAVAIKDNPWKGLLTDRHKLEV
jgi:bifunctional non-homologous end joining protein LigD